MIHYKSSVYYAIDSKPMLQVYENGAGQADQSTLSGHEIPINYNVTCTERNAAPPVEYSHRVKKGRHGV